MTDLLSRWNAANWTISAFSDEIARTIGAIPPQARMSDYFGVWAYECDRFWAQWKVIRETDLVQHMAAPALPKSPTVMTEPTKSGKSIARIVLRGSMMKGQSSF